LQDEETIKDKSKIKENIISIPKTEVNVQFRSADLYRSDKGKVFFLFFNKKKRLEIMSDAKVDEMFTYFKAQNMDTDDWFQAMEAVIVDFNLSVEVKGSNKRNR